MKSPDEMTTLQLIAEVTERRREERETTYYDCRDRYNRDPNFRSLVDLMVTFSIENKFTPGELRDAAFMASLQFESLAVRDMVYMVSKR